MPGTGIYLPLKKRRDVVIAAFVVIIAVEIAVVVSDVMQLHLVDDMLAGQEVTDADLTANDDRQQLIGVFGLGAYIIGAIAFIRWLNLAYGNVDPLGGGRRFGEGWAIGAWFVPFLNLVRPFKIVNDIWRRADGRGDMHPITGYWWACFLLDSLFSRLATGHLVDASSLRSLHRSTVELIASDSFTFVPALLAIAVVVIHTQHMDAVGAARAAEAQEPPATSLQPDPA